MTETEQEQRDVSTPAEHYHKADALMARVDEMKNPELRVSVALTAQAHARALIGLLGTQLEDDGEGHDYEDYWRHRPGAPMVTRRATGGRL